MTGVQTCALPIYSVHAPIVKTAAYKLKQVLGESAVVAYEEKLIPNEKCTKVDPRTDIKITNIITGKAKLVDFTFPTIKEEATDSNSTVMMAEESKQKFYLENYVLGDADVVPAVIDTYGRWGEAFKNLVKQVSRNASRNERDYTLVVSDLRATMAVTHVRSIGKQMSVFLGHHLY